MIWNGNGRIKIEPEHDEPHLRSCWECNPAHERLKMSSYFHTCFVCGKSWCLGWDFDQEASDKEFDAHFSSQGLTPGDSTTKIASTADEIMIIELNRR